MDQPDALPEIEVEELARRRVAGEDLAVLDVREPWERELCQLDASIDIPLSELPERVDLVPRQGLLVVLCHHGMRSARAAQWLRMRGYGNAVNLRGGIDAWARRIDPAMRSY
jgi:rhodanese-related sulfurtransferase